eukprot:scaffold8348_cov258-Pinguiococcus_pyrenoidosus.AAC.1
MLLSSIDKEISSVRRAQQIEERDENRGKAEAHVAEDQIHEAPLAHGIGREDRAGHAAHGAANQLLVQPPLRELAKARTLAQEVAESCQQQQPGRKAYRKVRDSLKFDAWLQLRRALRGQDGAERRGRPVFMFRQPRPIARDLHQVVLVLPAAHCSLQLERRSSHKASHAPAQHPGAADTSVTVRFAACRSGREGRTAPDRQFRTWRRLLCYLLLRNCSVGLFRYSSRV